MNGQNLGLGPRRLPNSEHLVPKVTFLRDEDVWLGKPCRIVLMNTKKRHFDCHPRPSLSPSHPAAGLPAPFCCSLHPNLSSPLYRTAHAVP